MLTYNIMYQEGSQESEKVNGNFLVYIRICIMNLHIWQFIICVLFLFSKNNLKINRRE